MPIGRVKWYDKSKGYGFIESPEGDVFFHFSDILMEGFKALAEDQRVSYSVFRSDQGLKAREIRPLDNRAAVRSAARYRTLIHMTVQQGKEEEFDRFFLEIPAWVDEMEQDLGVRRIGTWRAGRYAVHLCESDRPYEQTMQAVESMPRYEDFTKRQKQLREMLDDEEVVMSPVQQDVPAQVEAPVSSN